MLRYGTAVLFLAAVTVAVLLIRSGLQGGHGTTTTASSVPAHHVKKHRGPHKFYKVRAGDTLEGIAIRFRTSVHNLRQWNPKVDPNALLIGQRLRVR